MTTLKDKIETIADDLLTLEVTTIKGSLQLKNTDVVTATPATPATPADVTIAFNRPEDNKTDLASALKQIKVESIVNAKVVAGTIQEVDGDMVSYLDSEASETERLAHAELLKAAQASRTETIQMIASILGIKK